MDSDSSRETLSRRKILRRQNQEIKALKDEWKKALLNCTKKGSKKELDKEYNSKLESLMLSHKLELLKLSNENDYDEYLGEGAETVTTNIIQNNRTIETEIPELPSLYSNANFQLSKSERRRRKKRQELEIKHSKILQEYTLNSDKKGEIELNVINKKLQELNLKIHNISPDGNCLFGSIKHQLELKNMGRYSIKELRNIAVDYIEGNKETMEPFVLASIENSNLSFDDYCKNIRNTNEWGGEVELVALSNSLKVPITVIRSLNHRNECYGEQFYNENENSQSNTLYIVYHLNLFATGPHYNSTVNI